MVVLSATRIAQSSMREFLSSLLFSGSSHEWTTQTIAGTLPMNCHASNYLSFIIIFTLQLFLTLLRPPYSPKRPFTPRPSFALPSNPFFSTLPFRQLISLRGRFRPHPNGTYRWPLPASLSTKEGWKWSITTRENGKVSFVVDRWQRPSIDNKRYGPQFPGVGWFCY
jgi:hypothetical protein